MTSIKQLTWQYTYVLNQNRLGIPLILCYKVNYLVLLNIEVRCTWLSWVAVPKILCCPVSPVLVAVTVLWQSYVVSILNSSPSFPRVNFFPCVFRRAQISVKNLVIFLGWLQPLMFRRRKVERHSNKHVFIFQQNYQGLYSL